MPAGAAGSTISEEFETQYRVEAHGQKREQRVAHRQTIGTTAAQGVQAHAIVEDPRYASGKTYTLSAADVSLASLKTTSQSYGMGKKATDLWSRFLISKHEEVAVPDLTVLFMYGAFVALDINAALAVPHMGAPPPRGGSRWASRHPPRSPRSRRRSSWPSSIRQPNNLHE